MNPAVPLIDGILAAGIFLGLFIFVGFALWVIEKREEEVKILKKLEESDYGIKQKR